MFSNTVGIFTKIDLEIKNLECYDFGKKPQSNTFSSIELFKTKSCKRYRL